MTNSTSAIDRLYRKLFPKMVNALVRNYGINDINTAEDIVQETFTAAYQQWNSGMPDRPEAWLFKVVKNITLKTIREKNEFVVLHSNTPFDEPHQTLDETDATLNLLLSCIHPRFSPKQQLIISLRYVAGLKVNQIAQVLGAKSETITKILQRIREIFKVEKIRIHAIHLPLSDQTKGIVLKTIYLMFTEGYKTSQGKSILNLEICEEALSLVKSLINDRRLVSPEAYALYALMLFNLARFESRFDEQGELIDLENQNRTRWNQEMVQVAIQQLLHSKTEKLSGYHLEATIAYLHCTAESFQTTDWNKIVSLYQQLHKINESPFIVLNLAVAQFYSGNTSEALKKITALGKNYFLRNYYLYHVACGKIFRQLNDEASALQHFKEAQRLAPHQAEKIYIQKLIS